MATAEEFATVDWHYMLDDPAEPGTKKSAEWMMGHARWDAWNAFKQAVANTERLDKILAIVQELQASGIPAVVDEQAIAVAVADEFHKRSQA